MNGDNTKPAVVIPIRPSVNEVLCSVKDLMAKNLPPVQWIVEGLLPEGLCLIGGKSKVGKSWLALSLCESIATGTPFLGKLPVKQGTAIYLSLEDYERRLKSRLEYIKSQASSNFLYATRDRLQNPRRDGKQFIEDCLQQHTNCKLIVVDTLAKIRPARRRGSNDYDEDTSFGDELQATAHKHHACLTAITHTRKEPAEDYLDTILGSTGVVGTADFIGVLNRGRGENKGRFRAIGRDLGKELDWGLQFRTGSSIWELTDGVLAALLSSERMRVVDLLIRIGQPITPTTIAEQLQENLSTIKTRIRRMKEGGFLVSNERGEYSVHQRYL